MPDDMMIRRFPGGLRMLRDKLQRERIPLDKVDIRLLYFSWSWSLEVTCPSAAFKAVRQLPPEDLKADTAFSELCDSIIEELAQKLRFSDPSYGRSSGGWSNRGD